MANGLRDALDAAWGEFPTEDIGYDWLRYTGNARPDAGWVSAVTQHSRVTFIQETTSTRSQQGFLAGVYDCQFAEPRARAVHPNVESIAVVVSDGWRGDVWDCSEYGRGWASVATIAFFPYGAVPICESFIVGAGSSPLNLGGTWVPETWGAGTLMSQVVGPSPIDNTDLNHVWAPYYPTTPIIAPSWKDYDMHIGVNKAEGWFVVDGGKLTSHFTGPDVGFGVPQDATTGQWPNVPAKVYTDAEVAELKKGVSVGSVSVDIDYVKMAQAVTAGMRGL